MRRFKNNGHLSYMLHLEDWQRNRNRSTARMGEMSVPLLNGGTTGGGIDLLRIVDAGCTPVKDRRQRVRVALSLPVRLIRADGASIESTTHNVSSEGFYCSTGTT